MVDRNIDDANSVVSNVKKQGGKAICVKADVQSTDKLDIMADEAMDTFGKQRWPKNNARVFRTHQRRLGYDVRN